MAGNNLTPSMTAANRGSSILVLTWIEASIALLIVGARMYTRSRLIHNVGLDDWTILLALLFAIISSCLITAAVPFGVGRHFQTLDPVQQVMAVKLNWISQPFAIYSCGAGKISVSILLLRIMAKNKLRERFLYALIAILIVINTVGVASIFFQCTPSRKLWEPSIGGICLEPYIQRDIGFAQASFSSFSDFVLALFPLSFIWKLQTKLSVRLGLGCALSLGLIATVAATVKTVQLQKQTARSDYTYDSVALILWFVTEMYSIIIAACVPTLRPLLPVLYGKAPSRKSNSGRRDAYLSALYHRKKGYRTYENDDLHGLEILPPPPSHGNPSASGERQIDIRHDRDVDSGGMILPKPGLHEIMRSTEVDVSIRKDSTKNTASFARRETTAGAENHTPSGI